MGTSQELADSIAVFEGVIKGIHLSRLTEAANKPEFRTALNEFYFYRWPKTSGGFMTQLFDLIFKADANNREKIRKGFPYEVLAWETWNYSKSEEEFLKTWGLAND